MTTELRITPTQWLAAGAAALVVHALLIFAFSETSARGGAAGAASTTETRLRLSLGRPAPPVTAPAPSSALDSPAIRDHAPAPEQSKAIVERAPDKQAARSASTAKSRATSAEPASSGLDTPEPLGVAEALAPATLPGTATESAGNGSSQADGGARRDYFDALFEQVVATLDYPRRARLDEIEGTVVLRIQLDRAGEIEQCEVAESSGSTVLDRHAARIARRAAPFGVVPESLADEALVFELPLEFALTR